MFCMKCGQELPDNSAFCVKCGSPVVQLANQCSPNQENPNQGTPIEPGVGQPYEGDSASGYQPQQGYQPQGTNTSPPSSKRIKCPNCGGRNLQSISDTSTTVTSKGYSGAQGCLGYLIFGPCGLLCGNCGSKTTASTDSKTYWVCSDCGHKFRNLSEWKKEIEDTKTNAIVASISLIGMWVLFWFATTLEEDLEPLLYLMSILILIVILTLYFSIRKASKDYEILERSSMD